jgi:hypothetical protein
MDYYRDSDGSSEDYHNDHRRGVHQRRPPEYSSRGPHMFVPPQGTEIAAYRTAMCKFAKKKGGCHMRDICVFAHNEEEMRNFTDPIPRSVIKLYKDREKNNRGKSKGRGNSRARGNSKTRAPRAVELPKKQASNFIFEENDYAKYKHPRGGDTRSE